MNMYVSKLQRYMPVTALLILLASPLLAQDEGQLSRTEFKDKWGQVIFCQRIYKMPEVKSRLYSFDIEQCDKAGKLALDIVAKYPKEEQAQLKNQAERHAFLLSQNTSEPYLSVPACREYCKALAEIQDKRSD
jgi:hypothetical protein